MSRDFSRQSFLGENSEQLLQKVRVGVVGLGGGGSHVVQQLSHLGVLNLVCVDGDVVEDSNLNRLVGATAADVAQRTPKAEVARRVALSINPDARVTSLRQSWQSSLRALARCSVILGCVDSFKDRDELETFCRRSLIPYIDIGMTVSGESGDYQISGQVVLSAPGQVCLRCMGVVTPDNLAREQEAYGDAGPRPQVVWSNGILASAAVGVFVQLVCPWSRNVPFAVYQELDGNLHALEVSPRTQFLPPRCEHLKDAAVGDPLFRLPS